MKPLLIALLTASAAVPALGQHEGHGEEGTPPPTAETPADPHAGHDANTTPPVEQEVADPHAGHEPSAAPRAEQEPADPHAGHEMNATQDQAGAMPEASPPPAAFSGPVHAADAIFDPQEMAEARELLRAEQGALKTYLVLADRFETRASEGEESYLWDVQGWYGGDINKLWLKSEGEGGLGDNPEDVELQALYSRAITPFFDFQAGVRRDFRPDPERSHLVLGIQGLLPQVFEIDAVAFLSDEGDLTGQFEAEYDLRINQRLVLQPRIELNFAGQAIPELGVGPGIGSVEGGLRLRYEIRREIAPYIGIGWERKLGGTADFARAAGEDRRSWEMVLGVRSWF